MNVEQYKKWIFVPPHYRRPITKVSVHTASLSGNCASVQALFHSVMNILKSVINSATLKIYKSYNLHTEAAYCKPIVGKKQNTEEDKAP